jgi:predicted short-subunit dehydrogenase-like oxidoreductase (DUF2520 family)
LIKVFIVGSGRLAHNLVNTFTQNGVEVTGLYARNLNKGKLLSQKYDVSFFADLTSIPVNCDVYFLAVSDNAIEGVSNLIKVNGLVVHCSGMMDTKLLHAHANCGVFWPVQSLNEEKLSDFKHVPICIESSDDNNKRILEVLSDKVSSTTLFVSQEQRNKLHLTAVMVNNFSNHLFHLANDFLEKNKLPFSVLFPLIEETFEKVKYLHPKEAQTGPAARKDHNTIEKQMALLADDPKLQLIYKVFTDSILQNKY